MENILDAILENYPDSEFIIADGFNDAVIGCDMNSERLVYSVTKCLEILENDMSYEDSLEHFDFNIFCAYIGEHTPIWCWDNFYIQ